MEGGGEMEEIRDKAAVEEIEGRILRGFMERKANRKQKETVEIDRAD